LKGEDPAPDVSETEATMNDVPQAPAVACSLSQAELASRSARWRELAGNALEQVTRTSMGQRLTFRAGQGVADELDELAALERGCCAFATWSVERTGGQLILDVTAIGPEGAEAVHAIFADLPRVGSA
jgi:hypothetical protein